MNKRNQHGQSLSEYSFILGLVVVLAIGALIGMGGQIKALLGGTQDALAGKSESGDKKNGLVGLLNGPVGGGNGGTYKVVIDPKTGKAVFEKVNASEGTNTTAGEGKTVQTSEPYALGTLQISGTLSALAQSVTDPEGKAYIEKVAKLSYFLGANEGELDDIEALENNQASNADALVDLMKQNTVLQELLKNPPASLKGQIGQTVQALGGEVSNIADQYKSALKQFINADGQVTTNWSIPKNCENSGQSCYRGGKSGDTLLGQYDPAFNQHVGISGFSISNSINYESFKQQVGTMLNKGLISSEPVKITLTDAQTIDEAAENVDAAPEDQSAPTQTQ